MTAALGFAWLFALATPAGSGNPVIEKAGSSGSLREEKPRPSILYFEESSKAVSPPSKPVLKERDPEKLPEPQSEPQIPPTKSLLPKQKTVSGKNQIQEPAKRVKSAKSRKPATEKAVSSPQIPAAEPPTQANPPAIDNKSSALDTFNTQFEHLAASDAPSINKAHALEIALGEALVAYKDAGKATRLGWLYLDGKDTAMAAHWFKQSLAWRPDDAEPTQGLAYAHLADHNFDESLRLADLLPPDTQAQRDLKRESFLGLAQADYNLEQYSDAIKKFEAAKSYGLLPRHGRLLMAWSQFRLGEIRQAADQFISLYREAPDAAAAEGIVATATAHSALGELANIEPLASRLRSRDARAAFSTQRYLTAREQSPQDFDSVGSFGTLSVAPFFGQHEKSGVAGFSRLKAFTSGAEVSIPISRRLIVTLTGEESTLNAGVAETTLQANRMTLRESSIGIRWEHEVIVKAHIGPGVQQGAVSARPIGEIDINAITKWADIDARAYVTPLRETIQSWSGMRDLLQPDASASGGVLRRGAEFRIRHAWGGPWSSGLQLLAEREAGVGVVDNQRRQFNVNLSHDFGLSGFTYTALSAAIGRDAYARNVNFFLPGNGAYFSPQSYRSAGLAFDFRSEDGKSWMIAGRGSAARVLTRLADGIAYLPAGEISIPAATNSRGYDATARISAVVQITNHLQFGAILSRSFSPQYGESLALFQLRILINPRKSVVSADLPTFRNH